MIQILQYGQKDKIKKILNDKVVRLGSCSKAGLRVREDLENGVTEFRLDKFWICELDYIEIKPTETYYSGEVIELHFKNAKYEKHIKQYPKQVKKLKNGIVAYCYNTYKSYDKSVKIDKGKMIEYRLNNGYTDGKQQLSKYLIFIDGYFQVGMYQDEFNKYFEVAE